MAALIRHGFWKTTRLTTPNQVRCYSNKRPRPDRSHRKGIDKKVCPKIESTASSLAAKGFLRAQNDYNPPPNLSEKLNHIFKNVVGSTTAEEKVSDLDKRFALFAACSKEFNHSIPNSMLHRIETLGDLVKFYETPVDTRTPLDKMRHMELPENLHVQFEYHRYHPDTDGQTAFNKSSTLVTGLKYRKKYHGYEAEGSLPKY